MVKSRFTPLLTACFGTLGMVSVPNNAASALTLQCVPRDAFFEALKATNSEVPAHAGLASSGALFEVLVNPDGSWTAFFSFPDGLTCPVAMGEGWRSLPAAAGAKDPAA